MKWRETEKEMPKGDGYVWVMEIDESVPTLRESSLVRDFDKGDQMGFPLWAYAIEPEDTQQYKDEMENARLNTIKWNMECREQYKAMKAKEEANDGLTCKVFNKELQDRYDKAYTAAQDMWDSIDKDISNRLKEAMEKDKELKEEDENKSSWKLFSEEKPEIGDAIFYCQDGKVDFTDYIGGHYLNNATHWMTLEEGFKFIPKPIEHPRDKDLREGAEQAKAMFNDWVRRIQNSMRQDEYMEAQKKSCVYAAALRAIGRGGQMDVFDANKEALKLHVSIAMLTGVDLDELEKVLNESFS